MFIRIESEIRPTESESKVYKAISNLFDVDLCSKRVLELPNLFRLYVIECDNVKVLEKFRQALWRQRILDTARSYMMKKMAGNVVQIKLNKQAAYVGVVSFVDSDSESPLGPINVVISSSKIEELIDWLAPRTSKGKPLWEIDMPEGA